MDRNKAIKIIKSQCPANKQLVDALEFLIPELKESEDERLMKTTISFLKEYADKGYENAVECIDWLEKHVEQSVNILWHDANEEPEELREIFCEWETNDATWHDVVFYRASTKTFWDGERQIENVVKWAYVDEMLEKKSEPQAKDFEEFINKLSEQFPEVSFAKLSRIAVRVKKYLENKWEQKPALSEEDKKKFNRIYTLLAEAADEHAFSTTHRLIGDKECVDLQDFLKFIKDRVQPQPKQE